MTANWNYPTPIHFGAGRLAELPEACRTLGIARPLLVTDPGLAALPLVRHSIQLNEASGIPTGLYAGVRPNPVGANVAEGVDIYRAGGHDGVIAMGGGSALDVGKAIGLMVGQSRPLWDFEDVGTQWKRVNVEGMVPVLAVPTTSGTGSEVGRVSVITEESTHTKRFIFHPKMMPGLVLADPETTLGLSPKMTAAVGMDALAHNLESLCSDAVHPMADGIATEGVRLIHAALLRAYRDGSDLEARSMMMAASIMGGAAFQKGLGAIHSLSHPVGTFYDLHHGLTNGVFMPYVLVHNRAVIGERMNRLARYLGVSSILDWVLELREQLGIPHTLKELGVESDRFGELAERAVIDPTAPTNPLPLTVPACEELLMQAYEGRLGA